MIILKLKAGLGNQLFQYAYARARALRSDTKLQLDISWYNQISSKDTVRTFDLAHYNIQAEILNTPKIETRYMMFFKKVLNKIKRDILKENDFTFYKKYFSPVQKDTDVSVEGYFNSEKYFIDYSDVIREELKLKNPLGAKAAEAELYLKNLVIDGKVPVLIHVRRGDYVTNKNAANFHGVKTNTYYADALIELQKRIGAQNITYILSSDDVHALQNEIVPLLNTSEYHILSNPEITNYEEIHLMSLCEHFIIANSTFSWWGAWLSNNKNKVVIGPKEWVSNPNINTPDVLPDNWVRI